MGKFKISYQNENNIVCTLNIRENLKVSFDIFMDSHTRGWIFLAGKSLWSSFSLENEKFQVIKGGCFESFIPEEFILINNGFYELMKQLKEDSKWRLKIMHLLNDESRKVWDKV